MLVQCSLLGVQVTSLGVHLDAQATVKNALYQSAQNVINLFSRIAVLGRVKTLQYNIFSATTNLLKMENL